MKTTRFLVPTALVLATVASTAILTQTSGSTGQQPAHLVAKPGQPTLVHAQRFDLAVPARHYWQSTAPLYDSGWLLVLAVDPAMVVPHEKPSPVLYVGAQTAERINVGVESGRVVVIVPGDTFLVETPIFFGSAALPEEITGADIQRQLAAAVAKGVLAPRPETVARALDEPLKLADAAALRRHAIDLVEQYAPTEQDLIRGSRVPLVK